MDEENYNPDHGMDLTSQGAGTYWSVYDSYLYLPIRPTINMLVIFENDVLNLQVPAPRVFCRREKPSEDIVQSRCLERRCYFLPVPLWKKGIKFY